MGKYNRDYDDPEANGAFEVIDALLDLKIVRLNPVPGEIGVMELQGLSGPHKFEVSCVGGPLDRNEEVRIIRDFLTIKRADVVAELLEQGKRIRRGEYD